MVVMKMDEDLGPLGSFDAERLIRSHWPNHLLVMLLLLFSSN